MEECETGATHFVQMVDVDVIRTVERTVLTCCVGGPLAGVMVLVTGQDVIVAETLSIELAVARLHPDEHHHYLHFSHYDFLNSLWQWHVFDLNWDHQVRGCQGA